MCFRLSEWAVQMVTLDLSVTRNGYDAHFHSVSYATLFSIE